MRAERIDIPVTTLKVGVQLQLNLKEASFLRDILWKISGSFNISRRAYANEMLDGLNEALAGVEEFLEPKLEDLTGSIHCADGGCK